MLQNLSNGETYGLYKTNIEWFFNLLFSSGFSYKSFNSYIFDFYY